MSAAPTDGKVTVPKLETPIESLESLQGHPEVKKIVDAAVAAAVRDHKARTEAKYGDYEDLVKFRDEAQEMLTRATDRITELETGLSDVQSKLSAKDTDLLRQQVSSEKKVPVRWVLGATEEEMKSSADAWLQDVKDRSRPEPVPSQQAGTGDVKISTFDAGKAEAEKRFGKAQ